MSLVHHLDQATLVSYSAGSLSSSLRVVAATHLSICASCREWLRVADSVGGALIQRQEPASLTADARAAMLARLDEPADQSQPGTAAPDLQSARTHDPDRLPSFLHRYFGETYSALRWRTLLPGFRRIRAKVGDGELLLLSIAPGKSMPLHSHQGNELTLVLRGAYDDELGHFGPGDIADLDADVEHQPVTSPGEPCICLAALDAPLRFPGRIARLLQPVFGF